jgi:glycosyltransferase involved in cell wall biosynthesis
MPKQRVLFEAGPMLDNQKTGVGYYVSHLVASLQNTHADKLELSGYYFNFLNRRGNKIPDDSSIRFHKIMFMPGKLLSVCRRFGFQPVLELFIRKKSDTVIFTNYVALPQLRKRKTVLVIYDLGFMDVPQFTQSRNLTYLKRFCPPSIRKADTIITISEFTKARLKYYFPDITSDIVVTPIPPMADGRQKVSLNHNLQSKGIIKKGYVLYVGTIEPRKNLETLIAGYAVLDPSLRARYSLVLAGGKGWKDESTLAAVAAQQSKGMNIILTGYVSDLERNALYSNAACFVLPSHYEGFGMPLLEAMQYGIPEAVSDIPVFREVMKDAAAYFDKDDSQDIADKISTILNDKRFSEELIHRAEHRLKTFSWEENADAVYRALQQ